MPQLIFETEAQGKYAYDLSGDTITLGRSSDNTIQIKDPSVSQHHAKLYRRGDNYVLEDLGSTNRSFLGNVPVMEQELSNSCILKFGTVEAVYKLNTEEQIDIPKRSEQLEQQIDGLRRARDLANDRNVELSKENEELTEARDSAVFELEDLKNRLEALERKHSELARAAEEAEEAEEPKSETAEDTPGEDAARELEGTLEDQRKQIADLLDKHAAAESARCAAEEKLAQVEADSEAASAELQKKLEAAESHLQGPEARIAELEALVSERDRQREESEAKMQAALDAASRERDEARGAIEQLQAELNERREAEVQESDGKLAEVTAELERTREELETLKNTGAAVAEEQERSKDEASAELDALRKSIDAITMERDAALRDLQQINAEKDSLAASFEEERSNAKATSDSDLAAIRTELEQARNETRETAEDRDAIRLQKEMLSDELHKAHEAEASAKSEREEAVSARDQVASEIEAVRAEKDALSTELAETRTKIESLASIEEEKDSLQTSLSELREQFQSLNKHTGELLARISNGGDPNDAVDEFTEREPELKRFVGSNFRRAEGTDALDDEIFIPDPPAKPTSEGPVVFPEKIGNWLNKKHNAAPRPAPAPSATTTAEAEEASRSRIAKIPDLLAQMRQDLQHLIRHKSDQGVLGRLLETSQSVSETAGSTDFLALQEMARALENLIRSLRDIPERVEQSSLRTVRQSIDFLGTLLDPANLERTRAMEPANVLAVDDDSDLLDHVLQAMEQVNLQSTGVAESMHCLDTMEKQQFDLLLLDVRLPEITGWDVCTKVRAMPGHQKTPIIFLTGLSSSEDKAQSLLRGGNDFIAKPFNARELGIKALMWVYRRKLELL